MVKQYLEHSKEILTSEISEFKANQRTGTGHISLFGYMDRYDLEKGFPLLTTKRIPFKMVAHELIWFLRGETNIKYLVDNNVPIWNDDAFNHNLKRMVEAHIFSEAFKTHSQEWLAAREEYIQRIKEDKEFAATWGDLGPVYGSQWMHWPKFIPISVEINGEKKVVYIKDSNGIDQIADTLNNLKKNRTAKRYIVSAWNPEEISNMALPPCHTLFHVASNGEDLDLLLYQRSCDMFLGVPFNIASYAMLTQKIAQESGLRPRRFVHVFGDSHFYCGTGERAIWYRDNLETLKTRIRISEVSEDYQNTLAWLNEELPSEPKGKEGQDHITGILEQLTRTPRELPQITISDTPYNKMTIDDFKLEGYDPAPSIKRKMAV